MIPIIPICPIISKRIYIYIYIYVYIYIYKRRRNNEKIKRNERRTKKN